LLRRCAPRNDKPQPSLRAEGEAIQGGEELIGFMESVI
jgi:hypothetical protein